MVRGKEAQVAALVYVTAAIILQCAPISPDSVGLLPGAQFYRRFTYVFFHANWLHLAVNCWALLSIMFLCRVNVPMLLASFAIAASYPINALAFLYQVPVLPTLGASGLCYALLGRLSLTVSHKLRYLLWMIPFLSLGFIFKVSNGWLHLYCYLLGVILSALNMPVQWKR